MKILVFSSTPWNTDNSFGSTYSNIFEGLDDLEFANIYCSYGSPKNNITGVYFQIAEKSLLRNLFDPKVKTGRVVVNDNNPVNLTEGQASVIKTVKIMRWRIFFWMRRFLWWIGRWQSKELIAFIKDFKPEIIFVPLYHSTYLNSIILFIKKITGVKMVAYVSDDVYTLKQFSLSPFYWFDRIITRRMVKKTVDQCEHLYVISDIQKKEYEKCFNKKCSILTKGSDFTGNAPLKEVLNKPLKIVYTGNIGAGRWRTLARIGRQLHKINQEEIRAQLYIYSMTPLSRKMEQALIIENTSFFMGGVPSEKIPGIQADADVLVHVEPTNLKERLEVRHSFSTKIVDYFHAARSVFAVGTPDVASINYLIENDAAIVATTEKEIFDQLNEMTNNPKLIIDYAQKAWEFGKRNHQIDIIQKRLYEDLVKLVKDN